MEIFDVILIVLQAFGFMSRIAMQIIVYFVFSRAVDSASR